jgi:hypothetical protein
MALSRTLPTRTRVYGPSRLPGAAAVAAGCLALVTASASSAQLDLDCARLEEARRLIGRLRLAEIEGAEDIHRAAMWDAFGRCPEGKGGAACRSAEQRRFEEGWQRQKRGIEAKYGAMLVDLERRCQTTISREGGQSGFFRTRASSPTTPRRNARTQTTKIMPCTTVTHAPS